MPRKDKHSSQIRAVRRWRAGKKSKTQNAASSTWGWLSPSSVSQSVYCVSISLSSASVVIWIYHLQDSASAHSDLFTFFDYHRLAATSRQTLSVKGESAGVWLEWLLVLVGVVGEGVVLLRSYGTLRVVTVLLGCCCPSATEMSVVVTAVNWLVKCLLLLHTKIDICANFIILK